MSQSQISRVLAAAARLGSAIEASLLVAVLSAMIILAAGQIVARNVGAAAFPWADEALRVMVLWVAMLGAVAASREQRHVSIDAIARVVPAGVARLFRRVGAIFAALVSGFLAWYSYLFVADSLAAEDFVFNGTLPAWTVQLILPVGFLLICYRYTLHALTVVSAENGSVSPVSH